MTFDPSIPSRGSTDGNAFSQASHRASSRSGRLAPWSTRASGHYGQRIDVDPDANVTTRLIAFIGRDPLWQPTEAQ
jgi:hypothetical protein